MEFFSATKKNKFAIQKEMDGTEEHHLKRS
jgi:hypothetical protein